MPAKPSSAISLSTVVLGLRVAVAACVGAAVFWKCSSYYMNHFDVPDAMDDSPWVYPAMISVFALIALGAGALLLVATESLQPKSAAAESEETTP